MDPAGVDPGSNPADDAEREPLEEYSEDTAMEELPAAFDQLTEDEVIDLIALAWVERGDLDRSGWLEARAMADGRHRKRSSYSLIGMSGRGDHLEENLSQLDYFPGKLWKQPFVKWSAEHRGSSTQEAIMPVFIVLTRIGPKGCVPRRLWRSWKSRPWPAFARSA